MGRHLFAWFWKNPSCEMLIFTVFVILLSPPRNKRSVKTFFTANNLTLPWSSSNTPLIPKSAVHIYFFQALSLFRESVHVLFLNVLLSKIILRRRRRRKILHIFDVFLLLRGDFLFFFGGGWRFFVGENKGNIFWR